MFRVAVIVGALTLVPALASAQQPCTTDARRVVDEIYRHLLERAPDQGSATWVDRLTTNGMTVREVVREIAKSPEHLQRWGNESRESVARTLYRHILNREPDAAGQQTAVETMRRRGVTAVIDQFVNAPEYQQKFGDWGVPGSSGVNYCAPGARDVQSNNAPAGGRNMRFRRMDTNNDGVIQRSEWRGNDRSFDNFDWNNDGVLSGDEVSVRGGARQGLGEDDRNDNMASDERFDYLDINGNGFIDRNEWDGGYTAFERLDTSGDRRLSRAEFGANGRGSNFNSLDLNRDGRLSLNEWPWSHTSFDRQDENGDGVVSRGEYRGDPSTLRQ